MGPTYSKPGSYRDKDRGAASSAISDKRPKKFTIHWEDGTTSHMSPDEHKAYVASQNTFNAGGNERRK